MHNIISEQSLTFSRQEAEWPQKKKVPDLHSNWRNVKSILCEESFEINVTHCNCINGISQWIWMNMFQLISHITIQSIQSLHKVSISISHPHNKCSECAEESVSLFCRPHLFHFLSVLIFWSSRRGESLNI